jgi:hypothetical protein
VPFDFLKRWMAPSKTVATPDSTAVGPVGGIPFDGVTEEWRLAGRMLIAGRLSDALNRREPIEITDVRWAPVDGSAPFAPAAGLKSVDPYDLVLIFAGDDSLPEMNEAERIALKVHKVTYEVALEVPPYRVIGTVQLYPGSEPDSLLSRSTEMFVPILGASATMGARSVGASSPSTILVNRQYLRGVEQVDARTGERYEKLPGQSMGGTNWTDRAR